MSNATAAIGLTYASTDIQDSDFGRFLELVQGLNETPQVRGVDTVIPGRAGQVAGSRIFHRLPILLEGVVLGTSNSNFRTLMLALRTLFAPDRTPAALVATLEDSSTATVTARPLNIVVKMTSAYSADVSIELEALADWVIT